MEKKDAYEKKLEARLAEWQSDIDKLMAKAEQAEGDAQLAYMEQIDELRAQQKTTSDKPNELGAASDDAWEDLKEGIEKSWDDLSKATNKALSRFS